MYVFERFYKKVLPRQTTAYPTKLPISTILSVLRPTKLLIFSILSVLKPTEMLILAILSIKALNIHIQKGRHLCGVVLLCCAMIFLGACVCQLYKHRFACFYALLAHYISSDLSAISCNNLAIKSSCDICPRSPFLRLRTDTICCSRSFSPSTSIYGIFCNCASRIR